MFAAKASSDNSLPPIAGRSLRVAFLVFLVARIAMSLWAALVIQIVPAPLDPDPVLRPYVGQPAFLDGLSGVLLGPWQRFDTMRYLSLARDGYTAANSVFPPLYSLLIRAVGTAIELLTPASQGMAFMIAALLVSNLALIAALALLHYLAADAFDQGSADRALVYLVTFPTGFFLFAGYTESLFLLCTLASFVLMRRDATLWAGILGFLAALTRLTGWVLSIPLAYHYAAKRSFDWRRLDWRALGVVLPPFALLIFLWWRNTAGLPPIDDVYEGVWYQNTGAPGRDMWMALRSLFTGSGPRSGEVSLVVDILASGFLILMTVLTFRRLGVVYGLYSASLLFFMLLPTSELKPLYSFSRYTLAFFPAFMLMGHAGRHPWVHRLILYGSVLILLYLSGQFFVWGWVA